MLPAAADQVPRPDTTPDLHQMPQGNPGFVGQAQAPQLHVQGTAQPANAALLGGMPASAQIQHVPAGNALPSNNISAYASGQPQLPVHTPQQVPSHLPGPSQMPLADQYGPHSGQHAGQVMPADARGHSLSDPGQTPAQAPSSHAALSFEDAAQTMLTDIAKIVVFDQQGTVLFSSFQAAPTELSSLPRLFGDRDTAISSGMVVGSKRYEVHKFHPPLMYGRAQQGVEPDAAEGAALYAVEHNSLGRPAYAFATYKLPVVSAKAVPQLVQFVRQTMQSH